MHLRFQLLSFILLITATISLSGQSPTSALPHPDKATVYLTRVSGMGAIVEFKYFADDRMIGECTYGRYVKVELEPGQHLIWCKAENFSFLDIEVAAGETYVIDAVPQMGALRAGVKLMGIDPTLTKPKRVARVRRYLSNKRMAEQVPEILSVTKQAYNDALYERAMKKYEEKKARQKPVGMLRTPMTLLD